MVDKSDFNGLVKVELIKRPKITIRLESSVIDFTTLMKNLEKDEQKTTDKGKQKRRLFSDDPLPFDALKKVDADFVFKAKNIHAKDARLEFGHLKLILDDSNLSINKLEATYKKTKISGNLHIDPGSPPQVATNFLVQNFNLGDFLKETGKSDQVRAVVDIAALGKSRGDSVQSLMAYDNHSCFQIACGGVYLLLGAQDTKWTENGLEPIDPAKPVPFNHNPHYYEKDEVLKTGIRMHANVVLDYLNGKI